MGEPRAERRRALPDRPYPGPLTTSAHGPRLGVGETHGGPWARGSARRKTPCGRVHCSVHAQRRASTAGVLARECRSSAAVSLPRNDTCESAKQPADHSLEYHHGGTPPHPHPCSFRTRPRDASAPVDCRQRLRRAGCAGVALCRVLADLGIDDPFPIQTATLPDSLMGRDVLGRGRTGSGKTLAFVLPMLTRLAANPTERRPGRPTCLDPRPDPRARRADRCSDRTAREAARPAVGHDLRWRLRRPADLGVQTRGRHRHRLPRPARGPPRSAQLLARRCRDHDPRRGRPHGRPRVPSRGEAHHGPHPQAGAAHAVLGNTRRLASTSS